MYSGSAAQPQRRNRCRNFDKNFFGDFANTQLYHRYSTLLYMPQPSKSAKNKAVGIAKARQSRHTSRASSPGLLVPDPEIPTTPEGSRRSSSPGFEIMIDLDSGDISDGMTVKAATDSHLELEEDWGNEFDQENKDQEEDAWDEQGYVMEGEELEDIYGDDELEELEGQELEASLKLAMENQLKRIEQSSENYQSTPYEAIMQGASASEWKKAESKRGFGYRGPPAARTEREHRQKAREAEEINKEIRKG